MNNTNREALTMFAEESSERLEYIEADLNTLAQSSQMDMEVVHSLFRNVHSLKSAANLVGLRPVEQLAHKLEDILDLIRTGIEKPDSELISILDAGFTRIGELMKNPQILPLIDSSTEVAAIETLMRHRSHRTT